MALVKKSRNNFHPIKFPHEPAVLCYIRKHDIDATLRQYPAFFKFPLKTVEYIKRGIPKVFFPKVKMPLGNYDVLRQ